jgi:hypothetical protein
MAKDIKQTRETYNKKAIKKIENYLNNNELFINEVLNDKTRLTQMLAKLKL